MPDSNAHPHQPSGTSTSSSTGTHRHRLQHVGNYVIGVEIGSGSFAKVYKAVRYKTRTPLAIKAVLRQKLNAKLLENLESEINILKVVNNRNIVSLEDCFKNETHIYLVMEFCSGGDLSVYIKQRGRLETLDFVPRPGSSMARLPAKDDGKIFWPHPPTGGLDERVTRSFCGQLAQAIQFLRAQNLIHRDIKPQNLLLQPATDAEIADGHPLGIPVLKVADFGFARVLPAAAMAETLCGSPLYMAPEILRYEKYDAKADLWSVGAVLFEMTVGTPPFRANNHVELLRKIEKGQDRIKFPDESDASANAAVQPVSPDIKALIRGLLKRRPNDRMGFDEYFTCGVWDGHLTESTEDEATSSLDVSTDSSVNLGDSETKFRQMTASIQREESRTTPQMPKPVLIGSTAQTVVPDLLRRQTSQPTPVVAQAQPEPVRQPPVRRSQPKYYVGGDEAVEEQAVTPAPPVNVAPAVTSARATPRPIVTTAQRRLSGREREPASVEEPQPLTPTYPTTAVPRSVRGVSEGSPLAATPPITMRRQSASKRKDESALENSESGVGNDYVVVEKQTVEINALADELDQMSVKPTALVRRRSSRASVVTRPVSAFKPINAAPRPEEHAVVPVSYSPPFALSATPPFSIPPISRQPSSALTRPPSIPQSLNIFPPTAISTSYGQDAATRYGVSPSSLQTGALARALTNTAIRLIGTSATTAATALARATAKRRPTILRTGDIDPAEDELLRSVEDIARKAFVLFELADERLLAQEQLAHTARNPTTPTGLTGTTPPFGSQAARRKSSSSSLNSEVWILRQQEAAANDALLLYVKALAFIVQAKDRVKRYLGAKAEEYDDYQASQELNEMGQWLRARFNEIFEKIEWAKSRSSDSMLFPDWLVHDKARDMSRQAAVAELQGDLVTAEQGYETSLWLLQALLDEIVYDGGRVREDDRATYEKLMVPIKTRLDALRKKVQQDPNTTVARLGRS